jgi:hypothetical protein
MNAMIHHSESLTIPFSEDYNTVCILSHADGSSDAIDPVSSSVGMYFRQTSPVMKNIMRFNALNPSCLQGFLQIMMIKMTMMAGIWKNTKCTVFRQQIPNGKA